MTETKLKMLKQGQGLHPRHCPYFLNGYCRAVGEDCVLNYSGARMCRTGWEEYLKTNHHGDTEM